MTEPVRGYVPQDVAQQYGQTYDIAEYGRPQDLAELNKMTLIGMVDERGEAWHRRDDLQGDEDNHYPRFIPSEDVKRRLFGWEPRKVPVAFLVPVEPQAGPGIVDISGEFYRVVKTQENRVGILRSDNDYDLGVFKSGAEHPPYTITLMREAERLTGDILGITAAGCLQKGARAWVEFSMPETMHDDKSGFAYRPNLTIADSMDGSISLTKMLTINATICMNTLTWNLLEAKDAGRLVKRKHTRNIVSGKLDDERAALGILERIDAEFTAELHRLIETEVSEKQVLEVLDIIKPLPEDEGRGRTMADGWRDSWLYTYKKDPMSSQWQGTAFGVVQADNTFRHHRDPRRGGGRWEGNTWRALTGKTAQADREIVQALELVLA